MARPLPVKGTEISSAPCSVQRAAGLLRRFLSSEAGAEVGNAKGYIEAVAQSLEEMLARRRGSSGKEASGLATAAGRSSKFFNVEPVQTVPEVKKKKKSLKEADAKQKKRDRAMVDFEALLGHELDGEQANGELGFEEKPAVTETLPSTPRQADSADDGREARKKKKKRKSLVEGAMDEEQPTSKAVVVDGDPVTATKKKKKNKKNKSVDGVVSNGLTPAMAIKIEGEGRDGDMKPADEDTKKAKTTKMKKHGATPVKEEVLTNSSVGDRGSNGHGSEVQQGSAKKSKRRATEQSPVVKAFNF